MNTLCENIVTLMAAIFLFYVCYKNRIRKPQKKKPKRKYKVECIKNSEIRPEEIVTDQDLKREGYYNAI